jgi:hypothetical protein
MSEEPVTDPSLYVVSCESIVIDFGESTKTFTQGELLAGIPAGVIDGMIRTGRAKLISQAIEHADPVQVEVQSEQPEATLQDKLASGIEVLAVSEAIKDALLGAGLETIGDVIAYGEANGGLRSIDGIGKASEKAIFEAIEDFLLPQDEDESAGE